MVGLVRLAVVVIVGVASVLGLVGAVTDGRAVVT